LRVTKPFSSARHGTIAGTHVRVRDVNAPTWMPENNVLARASAADGQRTAGSLSARLIKQGSSTEGAHRPSWNCNPSCNSNARRSSSPNNPPIAVRQPAPPLGRQLNDRERLAVLDALALSTGDIDTRCPLRIVGGAGTRLLIGVRSTEQLKQLKPDYSRLTTLSAQLGAAGFFVFTLSHAMAGCLTESRMFCPALGIPEDPVSGNAHGLLGAYLAEQGLLPHAGPTAQFTGAQGHHVHRAGRVDVELEFTQGKLDGVWIVGQAVEIFETEMSL